MAIRRRFKKGSDSILQNAGSQWEFIGEGTQDVRSQYDFTQMDIPKIAPQNLQEDITAVVPESNDPQGPPAGNNEEKKLKKPWLKRFDAYIMKKFLGTFIFAILLLLAVVIMFDINEKLDAMLEAPLKETVFK